MRFTLLLLLIPPWLSSSLPAQELQYPLAIVETKEGTLYLADRNLPGVWSVKDGKASVYFQAAKKYRTPLNAIRCLALDPQGRLLAGDSATRDIYRFDENATPVPLTKGGIGIPMSIAVAPTGEIYVADLEIPKIWKVPAEGGQPQAVADVPAPRGLALDSTGSLWVISHGPNQVLKINPADGAVEPMVTGRPFQFPHQIALADAQTGYIVDGYGKTVWKITPGEKPVPLVSGEPFKNPVGLTLTQDGLLVVDPHAKSIYHISLKGKVSRRFPAP